MLAGPGLAGRDPDRRPATPGCGSRSSAPTRPPCSHELRGVQRPAGPADQGGRRRCRPAEARCAASWSAGWPGPARSRASTAPAAVAYSQVVVEIPDAARRAGPAVRRRRGRRGQRRGHRDRARPGPRRSATWPCRSSRRPATTWWRGWSPRVGSVVLTRTGPGRPCAIAPVGLTVMPERNATPTVTRATASLVVAIDGPERFGQVQHRARRRAAASGWRSWTPGRCIGPRPGWPLHCGAST